MNGKGKDFKELDPMDELTASLAALQEIQNSLAHLDVDVEDENFDWNKLNLQTDITSILKVMDQASGALDEVERRTDQLNAKLDALLAEGEETRKRVEERKAEDAKAKANGETSATDTTSEKSSTKDSDSKEGEESSKSEKEGESGSDKSEKEEAVIGTAEGSA